MQSLPWRLENVLYFLLTSVFVPQVICVLVNTRGVGLTCRKYPFREKAYLNFLALHFPMVHILENTQKKESLKTT